MDGLKQVLSQEHVPHRFKSRMSRVLAATSSTPHPRPRVTGKPAWQNPSERATAIGHRESVVQRHCPLATSLET
eukprot:6348527-Amphidinium_carterae.1